MDDQKLDKVVDLCNDLGLESQIHERLPGAELQMVTASRAPTGELVVHVDASYRPEADRGKPQGPGFAWKHQTAHFVVDESLSGNPLVDHLKAGFDACLKNMKQVELFTINPHPPTPVCDEPIILSGD